MEIVELYQALERIQKKGIILHAWSGENADPKDGMVLMEFADFFLDYYHGEWPMWAEAFYQIFSWQYQSFHEGVKGYYDNFYGGSDYQTIKKVAEFLQSNGYIELSKQYALGAVDCERYKYPEEKKDIAKQIDKWLNWNLEPVFHFYVDVLEKNKAELL